MSATSSIDYDSSDDFFSSFFLRTYGRDNVSDRINRIDTTTDVVRAQPVRGKTGNGGETVDVFRVFRTLSGTHTHTRRRAFVIIVLLNIYVDYYI